MSLRMTVAEREAFLGGVHVGVLSVAVSDRGPIAVPVWYAYEPGGDVVFMTGVDGPKAKALREAGRATLVVQREALPYAYVMVEGPVSLEPAPRAESAAIAERYLGAELGAQYMQGSVDDASVKGGKIEPQALNDTNVLELRVFGSDALRQAVLVARLDNLGKGASGAAVQSIKLMLGVA